MSRTSSRSIPGISRVALECGGLPPLCPPRACSRFDGVSTIQSASLLAVPRFSAKSRPASWPRRAGKAAASRRTPKQQNVATIKNLWSPSPEPATGLRSSRDYALTAPRRPSRCVLHPAFGGWPAWPHTHKAAYAPPVGISYPPTASTIGQKPFTLGRPRLKC